jgi:hypothetical protein
VAGIERRGQNINAFRIVTVEQLIHGSTLKDDVDVLDLDGRLERPLPAT